MPRNGSGTYTTPNSAVVTGTTITAADENSTRADLATELTDSLSRSNKGAMLAPLSLHDGASATVPDLTWSGDTDTGLGHSAANTLDLIAGGVNQMELTTTAATIVQNTTVSGTLTSTGAFAASSTANVVGNFSVATNKFNVTATTGDTTVAGVLAVTGAVTSSASGGIAKAWCNCTTTGVGGVTNNASFNIASVAISGTDILVTFTNAIGSANYAVVATVTNNSGAGFSAIVGPYALASGTFKLSASNSTSGADLNLAAVGFTFHLAVFA